MSIDATVMKCFHNLPQIHVLFSAATHMPFVTCDEETYNDQIWVFPNSDTLKKYALKYTELKMPVGDMIIKKEFFGDFFMDLHSIGVNEIIFCENGQEHKLMFSEFVKIPDFSKLPKNQQPLMNPELQLSTLYFFQEIKRPGVEPAKEKLEPLAEEMYANLAKARFLLPVVPQKNEEGKEAFLFPYLTDKNEKKFQPVFSDHPQYKKHLQKNKMETPPRLLLVGIEELKKYLLPHVDGYMLNPDGNCHVLTGQLLDMIIKQFKS